jgi:N-hydroxyarylamine O-acetyltransferase
MALEVRDEASNFWLADIGFGDCFLEPLSLTRPTESEQMGKTYRLLKDGDNLLLQRKSLEKDWAPQYQFTRIPHQLEEFAPMCHFHQTSPESSFTQLRLCSLATTNGRSTLEGMRLITTQNGKKTDTEVADEREYQRLLREKFGIELG